MVPGIGPTDGNMANNSEPRDCNHMPRETCHGVCRFFSGKGVNRKCIGIAANVYVLSTGMDSFIRVLIRYGDGVLAMPLSSELEGSVILLWWDFISHHRGITLSGGERY